MTVQPALVADDRETVIRDFLDKAGWGTAKRVPLTADASTRRYERLVKDGTTALLMDAPPAAESAPCPPDASPQQRIDLGYNAVARLAGPDSRRFAAFSAELRRLGLSAPEVYDAEYDAGLLLIEDLGDDLFARAMKAGQAETPLYEAAVDVLLHLHGQPAPHMVGGTGAPESPLLDYDTLALGAEADLLIEWLYPLVTGQALAADRAEAYRALWSDLLADLLPANPVIVLRDYHAENLIWLPQRAGLARVGLIDFQDGLRGHPGYDLMSLLEDARRDVDPALAAHLMDRYVRGAEERWPEFDAAAFRAGAATLGCQRNAKILGIFARLWKRDGKPKYLSFIPRLWRYIEQDLENPELAPLKAWFDEVFAAGLRKEPAPV